MKCIIAKLTENLTLGRGGGWFWWDHPEPDGSHGPFTSRKAAAADVRAHGNTVIHISVDYIVVHKPGYRARQQKQLDLWVQGTAVHNEVDDECCPDFSCCQQQLLVAREIREAYATGTPEARDKLLGVFLGEALSGENVYIAGRDPEDDS